MNTNIVQSLEECVVKAAVWYGAKDVRVEEVEVPNILDKQVKVQVAIQESVEVICMNILKDLFLFLQMNLILFQENKRL